MIDLLTGQTITNSSTYKTFAKVNKDVDLINIYNKEYIEEYNSLNDGTLEYDEFEIVMTGTTNINLTFPELKFNKTFVFNITSNGGYHGIYNYIQKYINGRYVETGNTENHDGMIRTSGITSPNILGYSDGLGTQIPFRVGMYYKNTSTGGTTNDEYITPNELNTFIDFYGTVGIDTTDVVSGFTGYTGTCNNLVTLKNTYNYTPLSTNGNFFMKKCTVYNGTNTIINSDNLKILNLYQNKTGITVNNTNMYYNEINLNKISTNLDSLYLLLNTINDTYGLNGDDTIWGATSDELYEWLFIKKFGTITKREVSGDTHFTITIPRLSSFKFKSISLLSDSVPNDVKIFGKYYNTTKGVNNSSYLINIYYDEKIVDKIEKYITLAENNKSSNYYSEFYQNATFFYNMLNDDRKIYHNFKTRYEAL